MRKTVKLSRTSESHPDRPLPEFVVPMACYVKEPIDSPDWIFETKLDCYRAIVVIDSACEARLWSRNHLPPEPKFPTVGSRVTSEVEVLVVGNTNTQANLMDWFYRIPI